MSSFAKSTWPPCHETRGVGNARKPHDTETRARSTAERFKWIEDALASDLPDELKVLAVRIGLHKNNTTGRCDPSEDGLAEGTNKDPRTVRTQRRKLRALGWINYADNRGGRGKKTQHELTKPGPSHVPLSEPAKGDVWIPKGGRVYVLNSDTATSPEPIEPIEPGARSLASR